MNRVLTEGVRAGAYIADEVSVSLSRKQDVVASGEGVVTAGTVLARHSGTGKLVKLVPGGSNDTDDAVAILFDTVDATTADQDCVTTAALTAVNASEITWPAGINDGQKAAAIAQLEARQITVLAADPITSGS